MVRPWPYRPYRLRRPCTFLFSSVYVYIIVHVLMVICSTACDKEVHRPSILLARVWSCYQLVCRCLLETHRLYVFSICTHSITVLFGYPPKELPDYNPLLTLESLGIKSGDTITLEELKSERQRTIEFRDVTKTQPNTSSTTSSNTSQNSNVNSHGQKKDSEVIILNSADAGNAVLSGTKRELDHIGGTEPSSSQKRSGKLSRK